MKEEVVLYNGKSVLRSKFRARVYNPEGVSTLANTWDEFQGLLATGLWHATKEQASNVAKESEQLNASLDDSIAKIEPKPKKKKG